MSYMTTARNRGEIVALVGRLGISVDSWGHGEAKMFDNLVQDVESGEAILELRSSKLVLTMVPCGVAVWCRVDGQNLFLAEEKQVFKRGEVRYRKNPSSLSVVEKKSPADASFRAAAERGWAAPALVAVARMAPALTGFVARLTRIRH